VFICQQLNIIDGNNKIQGTCMGIRIGDGTKGVAVGKVQVFGVKYKRQPAGGTWSE
jgi:hypothetical protein